MAVIRNVFPLRVPREFLGTRVIENAAHRAVGQVQQPYAIPRHLKDDACAIRRDSRRPYEPSRPRRLEFSCASRGDIENEEPILVAIADESAVREPGGVPGLADPILSEP